MAFWSLCQLLSSIPQLPLMAYPQPGALRFALPGFGRVWLQFRRGDCLGGFNGILLARIAINGICLAHEAVNCSPGDPVANVIEIMGCKLLGNCLSISTQFTHRCAPG